MSQTPYQKFMLLIACATIGTLPILAGLNSQENDKVKLSELSFLEGKITKYSIDYKRTASSYSSTKYKFIALNIEGSSLTFGIYRPNQKYEDILNSINIGDTASIYYRDHPTNYDHFVSGINYNSDIYQLKINNHNYIEINNVKSEHHLGNLVAFIGGIFIWILGIVNFILKRGIN